MNFLKWISRLGLGGFMGALGMAVINKFVDISIGWYYHSGSADYLAAFLLGAFVGTVNGVIYRDLKKLALISVSAGGLSILGHYLLVQIEKSRYLGEAVVIVIPIFSVFILAGFIAGGIEVGKQILLPQACAFRPFVFDASLRILCAGLASLIFLPFFYSNRELDLLISGFVVGSAVYLIEKPTLNAG